MTCKRFCRSVLELRFVARTDHDTPGIAVGATGRTPDRRLRARRSTGHGTGCVGVSGIVLDGRTEPATLGANWLASLQSHQGSLGVFPDQGEPGWGTAVAIMAWHSVDAWRQDPTHEQRIQLALEWLTEQSGNTYPRRPGIGHDTTIPGWPWVQGTHSWLEPTAWAVMALKVSGLQNHERCRDGVRLLLDRQLPDGGCNFGNTFALGQCTLPHVQPSAMALLALQGEPAEPPVSRLVAYLQRQWPSLNGTASLCWSTVALTAFGSRPADAEVRLQQSFEDLGDRTGGYHRALGILALHHSSPFIGLSG